MTLKELIFGKFPICNWDTDVYTNWLTQNGVNIGLSVAGSALSITASAVTGNPIRCCFRCSWYCKYFR